MREQKGKGSVCLSVCLFSTVLLVSCFMWSGALDIQLSTPSFI